MTQLVVLCPTSIRRHPLSPALQRTPPATRFCPLEYPLEFIRVEMRESDGALTGTIVWLCAPFGADGRTLKDVNHPEPTRHDRRVVGLAMLSDFRRESRGANIWTGGKVYDPGNGRTYQGAIRIDGPDRLLLRGFIGISLLGRTNSWIRVGSEESPPQAPLAARVAR